MKRRKWMVMGLLFSMIMTSCGNRGDATEKNKETEAVAIETTEIEEVDTSEMFSDRDFEVGYDVENKVVITLKGTTAECSSDAVEISGGSVTIRDEGTYILSGELTDGMIIVNADKEDKIQIVLDNVTIHSETSAPIYVLQADKVFITMEENSVNTLSNGGTFIAMDDNNIDAVIYAKDDLTLNGAGSLTITSPAGHGIVSKDELKLTSGTYVVNAASHGLEVNDNICIANVELNIISGKDGIHAENEKDESLGFVYVESGKIQVVSEGDSISAAAYMLIQDGNFNFVAGGGSENGEQKTSEKWGDFHDEEFGNFGGKGSGNRGKRPELPDGMTPGGRTELSDGMEPGEKMELPDGMTAGERPEISEEMQGNMPELPDGIVQDERPQMPETRGESETAELEESTEDSTSIKGIKVVGNLIINGGAFEIDAADDALYSNGNVTVSNGTFTLSSGDDGIHADENLTIENGMITISESYEGLEGLCIYINGGTMDITASDDGLNAAGGTDASGFGGFRGNDTFGKGGQSKIVSSDSKIVITGGTLYITASGDGVDSNGSLEITGGMVNVTGPTRGDTSILDYATTGTITGGTYFGTGSSMMRQGFSESKQGVITWEIDTQSAGTMVNITDKEGNVIASCVPELDYNYIIFSSEEIISGETYTITAGEISSNIALTSN